MDRGVGNPEQCSPSSSQAGERPTGHHGLELDSSVSTSIDSSDYCSQVALHQMIQTWPSLESPSPMRRRASKSKQNAGNSKNKKSSKIKNKSKNSTNSEKNRSSCTAEVCSCAASFTADCAAICCCPCAIVHLLILAFVRVPSSFARKALCYARKKAAHHCSNIKRPADHKDDHDDENDRGRYSFSPWSYTESPATTDGSPPPPKFDTQKLWTELYEAGYMGFGGPPFHWNNNHDDENDDDDDDACFHSSKADSLPRVSNS